MADAAMLRGLVFAIARFSPEDGPGIRTTVFLKGCPLHCSWCHSPQSQSLKPQLVFYSNRCINCGACAQVCPLRAQLVSETERRVVWEKCNDCGECAVVCPTRALEMLGQWFTVEELIDVIARDKIYYASSGGGVTFSGGEPAAQPEFLIASLKGCKGIGIHTALDSSGFVNWSIFKEMLPYIDLVLYDIKHMDSIRHKELTGVGNELILDNLSKLNERGKPIWVRIPLIPGYNDSEDNLRRIAEFVGRLRSVERVSLLPYNDAAGAKYQLIGKTYALEGLSTQSQDKMAGLAGIFSCLDVKVELGR